MWLPWVAASMGEHVDGQYSMSGARLQGQSYINTLGPVDTDELGRGPARLQVIP